MDGLSAVQLNTPTWAAQLTSIQSQRPHAHPAMDAAAKALGMTASDLRTALQSGKSLADIASSKGISQDTLVAAMATAIQQSNSSVTADQATKIATMIATRTPRAGGPGAPGAAGATDATQAGQATAGPAPTSGHHGHHHHHAMSTAMDAASQLLGTSTTDLAAGLKSGQSLSDLASAKGVSKDDLVNAIAAALQKADSNLSADDAKTLATGLASRTAQANGTENQPWAAASQGDAGTMEILA